MNDLKLGPQLRENQFELVDKPFAIVADSAYGTATGTVTGQSAITSVPATAWATGGFSWYSDYLPLVAFNGWNPVNDKQPDHGFFWFMNLIGHNTGIRGALTDSGSGELKNYLLKFISVSDTVKLFPGRDVYDALNRVRDVPAALRSPKIAREWGKFGAEDQLWLTEALSSIAGHFVRADSLLTDMAAELALASQERWNSFQPDYVISSGSPDYPVMPVVQLPDLTAFRFERKPPKPPGSPVFLVYPNPTRDYVIVQPKPGYSFRGGWDVYICSSLGTAVIRTRIDNWVDQKIEVSSLSDGVYFIEIFSGNQYLGTAKFVKSTTD
jgi:hypothetical protein